MLQLRRRPQKDLERLHARYVRANRRQLDFRVWVAGGWGIVIGMTAMWLFQRLLA
jgi:hypothetical protein